MLILALDPKRLKERAEPSSARPRPRLARAPVLKLSPRRLSLPKRPPSVDQICKKSSKDTSASLLIPARRKAKSTGTRPTSSTCTCRARTRRTRRLVRYAICSDLYCDLRSALSGSSDVPSQGPRLLVRGHALRARLARRRGLRRREQATFGPAEGSCCTTSLNRVLFASYFA